MKELIENFDLPNIRKALSANPSLSNRGIPLCETDLREAHPLHRLCDAVFAGGITDEDAVSIAETLLEYGADVNGFGFIEKEDTPLIAAASLYAERVGILYVDHGANIHHRGCMGGTALHWAAWCGLDKLVARLLAEKPEIDQPCADHQATPIFWAVHGLKIGHVRNQVECAKLLFRAGADISIPNVDGDGIISMLGEKDSDLLESLELR